MYGTSSNLALEVKTATLVRITSYELRITKEVGKSKSGKGSLMGV